MRMLLRSSSTPVLGSLLSETTPNNNHSPSHFHYNRLPFSLLSCNSSPSINADEGHDRFSSLGLRFRRAQSEGNLNTLDAGDIHEDPSGFDSCKIKNRLKPSMLKTILSFSFSNSIGTTEEEEEDNTDVEENAREEIGIAAMAAILTREVQVKSEDESCEEEREFGNQDQMYLARGLGIDGGGHSGGGGGDFRSDDCSGEGGEEKRMEEYYKNMVVQNPANAMLLRNYAQFLYQSKGDLRGAEEYYSRAIVIDSADGEILSQYAKLVWELHHDLQTASAYFERAVRASPHDCHVHAAYANFLWETEEDNEYECSVVRELTTHLDQTYRAAATA